jgi:hypothetical protein
LLRHNLANHIAPFKFRHHQVPASLLLEETYVYLYQT